MCGIVGAVGVADQAALREMALLMAHRGPDDVGTWIDDRSTPPVMLASRRLAILDLSSAGHMPMLSPDGRYVIVYNGEVYNFTDVRHALEGLGHTFRSGTDTEVVLAAYTQWGPDCLRRLNGMFAIAIWDTRERSLFLARDRLGVKPLYYVVDGPKLLFASEVKSLLVDGLHQARINLDALASYLQYQFVPWPDTMFAGVRKLAPAHYATFSNGVWREQRYWQLPEQSEAEPRSIEALGALLEDAVKIRMISDVPVGLFLSGGIDSSIVASLAARHRRNLIGYTVRFEEGGARYDETAAAGVVAEHLGLDHRVVHCAGPDATEALPSLIWHLDEPIGENLIYPFFVLSRAAREAFTVSLSGEGADELFHGYRYYTLEPMRRRAAGLIPRPIRRPIAHLAARFDPSEDTGARALAYLMSDTPEAAFHAWAGAFFTEPQLRDLITPECYVEADVPARMRERMPRIDMRSGGDLSPLYDTHFRLVDFILTARDKMSMAVGLEVRSPFLDYRIAEASRAWSAEDKLRAQKTKRVLRDVASGVLPHDVAQRRKIPFSSPSHWWMESITDQFLRDSELVGDGILRRESVSRYCGFGGDAQSSYPNRHWCLAVLEMWYRVFISGSLRPVRLPLPAADASTRAT